jgi:hypothetical protein
MIKLPRPWSLVDMIECFGSDFGTAYHKLCELISVAHRFDRENHIGPLQDQVVSKSQLYALSVDCLAPILKQLEHFEMKLILVRGKRLQAQLLDDKNNWTADRLLDAVKEFRRDVDVELKKRRFALLNSPNDEYFEQEKLFGDAVYKKLPKARADIKDAGNAFATELYTSAVFHLMRVGEYGLRSIAQRLGVTISDKGEKIPLEYGDWNKVITAIRNKLDEGRKMAGNAKKQAFLAYHSDGLERCAALKDLYRNEVSHTRKRYNQGEALAVMQRVRDLMQLLARPLRR